MSEFAWLVLDKSISYWRVVFKLLFAWLLYNSIVYIYVYNSIVMICVCVILLYLETVYLIPKHITSLMLYKQTSFHNNSHMTINTTLLLFSLKRHWPTRSSWSGRDLKSCINKKLKYLCPDSRWRRPMTWRVFWSSWEWRMCLMGRRWIFQACHPTMIWWFRRWFIKPLLK